MPTSWYQAIPAILDSIIAEKPQSILDVGIGFGKFGMLIRDVLEIPFERYDKKYWKTRLDGIEVFEDYKNPIHDHIYDNVYYSDVFDVIDRLPDYDVILLIDVIEHFSKAKGYNLLRLLLKHTNRALIVSTPLYPEPQTAYLGNEYEQHESRWSIIDLSEFRHSYQSVRVGDNWAQIFTIRPPDSLFKNPNVENVDRPVNIPADSMRPMTLGYVLPHKNLTGGMKMLLQQMKIMRMMGNRIYALGSGEFGESVLPDWSETTVDREILVTPGNSYLDYVEDCDVIMAGWVSQVPRLVNSKVPLVYWEQGHEWLFGDGLTNELEHYLETCYRQPCYLAAVSPLVAGIIETRYDRRAIVLLNGIDTDFYYPGDKSNSNTILLVGNPALRFKGLDVAVRTLCTVKAAGYDFSVKWVCQSKPSINNLPFPITYIVNPSQDQLAQEYRTSDIFLFTSWYEGFGMPPLEAMASGVSVVTTACGGNDTYVDQGFNALVAEPGDVRSLAASVIYLLENEHARQKMGANGRRTALRLALPKMVGMVDAYLRSVIESWRNAYRHVRD